MSLLQQAGEYANEIANRKQLQNYDSFTGENGKEIKCPISAEEIYKQFVKMTGGHVRRLDTVPFVMLGGEIKLLSGPADVFAYLGHIGVRVLWTDKAAGAVSKTEFYSLLQIKLERYDLISSLPSYPEMPGVFYTTRVDPAETGKLAELVGMFSCATEIDRQLLSAMFITPFWGGDCGKRPAFLIDGLENDSKGNRGIGKTTVTDALVKLCGGSCVDLTSKTEGDEMRRRLLTANSERIVRMDNIKSQTLSNDTLESMVTAERISGHKMFHGHSSIPNLFTYVLTFNDAVLSKDMSQRCIIIRLKRPVYQADWWGGVTSFINEHRTAIISDIGFILSKQCQVPAAASRFPEWERSVLGKCSDDLPGIQAQIRAQQESSDDDNHLKADIASLMAEKIGQIEWKYENGKTVYFDPETQTVAIHRSQVNKWLAELFHKGATTRFITKKFEAAKPAQFLPQPRKFLGAYYLIWVGVNGDEHGAPLEEKFTPNGCWRVSNIRDSLRIEEWNFGKNDDGAPK